MWKVISLQACAAILALLLVWAFRSFSAAWSAMLGALACIVPSAVFALRLKLAQCRGVVSPVRFLFGELLKLAAMLFLLLAVFKCSPGIDGVGVLIGVIMTLHANLFAFLLKS